MKSFHELPLLTSNPSEALAIEDGISAVIDLSGYDGPRGLAELLGRTARAGELTELVTAAGGLELSEVAVARTTRFSAVLDGQSHECLAMGRVLFAIATEGESQSLVNRFACLAASHLSGATSRWQLQVAYQVTAAHLDLAEPLPNLIVVDPSVEQQALRENVDLWGFGIPGRGSHVARLVDAIAEQCLTVSQLATALHTVDSWRLRLDPAPTSVPALLDRYWHERPLSLLSELQPYPKGARLANWNS